MEKIIVIRATINDDRKQEDGKYTFDYRKTLLTVDNQQVEFLVSGNDEFFNLLSRAFPKPEQFKEIVITQKLD